MKLKEFISSIRRSIDILNKLEMVLSTASLRPLPTLEEFKKVALDPNSKYENIYHAGLELSHYNFILTDYSYFQFSNFDARRLKLRYAFYPNPYSDFSSMYKPSLDLAIADGYITLEEYSQFLLDEVPLHHSPNIRYDVSEDQYIEFDHPYSHLTIGTHSENRWPVSSILTPYMFLLLIMKQYYGFKFEELGTTEFEGKQMRCVDFELINETGNCRRISSEFFSDLEKRQPHFC